MKRLVLIVLFVAICGGIGFAEENEYLGEVDKNEYNPKSVSNTYGEYGSEYSPKSIKNPYGEYGSEYSAKSANNPYTADAPKLYDEDGKYLGKLSTNQYDADSTSNPYGKYGSKYSADSINNPYGQYGGDNPQKKVHIIGQ